jgi:predicted Zn-dependent peptidase
VYERLRGHVDRLRTEGPDESEVDAARSFTAGRRVIALERTRALAHYGALQAIVFGEPVDPSTAITSVDAVQLDDVASLAHAIPASFALAYVGPEATSSLG